MNSDSPQNPKKWFHGVTTLEIFFKGDMSVASQKREKCSCCLRKNVIHMTSSLSTTTPEKEFCFYFCFCFWYVFHFALLLFFLLYFCSWDGAVIMKLWLNVTIGMWGTTTIHPVSRLKRSPAPHGRVKGTFNHVLSTHQTIIRTK